MSPYAKWEHLPTQLHTWPPQEPQQPGPREHNYPPPPEAQCNHPTKPDTAQNPRAQSTHPPRRTSTPLLYFERATPHCPATEPASQNRQPLTQPNQPHVRVPPPHHIHLNRPPILLLCLPNTNAMSDMCLSKIRTPPHGIT